MNFWDDVGFFSWGCVFFASLMLLLAIVGDKFRDPGLNGRMKEHAMAGLQSGTV